MAAWPATTKFPQIAAHKRKVHNPCFPGMPPGLASLLLAEGEETYIYEESSVEMPLVVRALQRIRAGRSGHALGRGGSSQGTSWMCDVSDKHVISVATGRVDVRAGGVQ